MTASVGCPEKRGNKRHNREETTSLLRRAERTLHLEAVLIRRIHEKRSRLAVQGIRGIRVHQELRKEGLEDIQELCKVNGRH